jgi:hypothetical protein
MSLTSTLVGIAIVGILLAVIASAVRNATQVTRGIENKSDMLSNVNVFKKRLLKEYDTRRLGAPAGAEVPNDRTIRVRRNRLLGGVVKIERIEYESVCLPPTGAFAEIPPTIRDAAQQKMRRNLTTARPGCTAACAAGQAMVVRRTAWRDETVPSYTVSTLPVTTGTATSVKSSIIGAAICVANTGIMGGGVSVQLVTAFLSASQEVEATTHPLALMSTPAVEIINN